MQNQIKQDEDSTEKVYKFLVNFITKNLYVPSIREICEGVYLNSTSSVYNHLWKLEEEGRIEIKENSPRAIKLVGYELVEKGNEMENIIARSDVKESNRIREEVFNNTIATLKKEVPLLSEEEIQKIETAFYSGTENYLFKRKVE